MQLVWKQTTARHLKGGKYEFLGEAKAGQCPTGWDGGSGGSKLGYFDG